LSHRLQAALIDALLAGYVAFALFCLTLGFRTVDSAGGLTLKSRPMLLAIAVGSVFVGRLLLNLWWNGNWNVPRPAWRPVLPFTAVTRYGAENGAMVLVIGAALFPILGYFLEKTLHLGLPLRYLLDLSIHLTALGTQLSCDCRLLDPGIVTALSGAALLQWMVQMCFLRRGSRL
jgi:hypothetical protein